MKIYFSTIQESKHKLLLEANLKRLPEDFKVKIKKFRRWQDAQASLLGRLLLERGIQEVYQKELVFSEVDYGIYGKPQLGNSNINFNISHSGEIVACILANNQAIGIDVELVKDTTIADLRRQMTVTEWELIQRSEDRLLAFYDYWTSKEAVLKASGRGFSLALKSFEINPERTKTSINDQIWYLRKCFLVPNYLCYIASDKEIKLSPTIYFCEF